MGSREKVISEHFPEALRSGLEWGAKSSGALFGAGGAGAGAGKVRVSELTITKPRGSASATLQMFVFNGKHIPKAEIRFYKSGPSTQVPYLTITLEDVMITSWSISSDGEGIPKESFSLAFAKFKTEDAIMKADGTMEKLPAVGWDIQKNAAQ